MRLNSFAKSANKEANHSPFERRRYVEQKYAVAGLGNALMDALIVMDSDDFWGQRV